MNGETLSRAFVEGTPEGNLPKSKKYTTPEERYDALNMAYDACSLSEQVTIHNLAEYMVVTDRCARDRIKENAGEFQVKGRRCQQK